MMKRLILLMNDLWKSFHLQWPVEPFVLRSNNEYMQATYQRKDTKFTKKCWK